MPFVRFSRDKRGYEHLYLVDTGRERGRSRVLYWFRTPPGVRVGRNPFDAETQKALERQNPDVQFDWPQIVAAKIAPPVPVESWREKRRIERAIKRARAEEAGTDAASDAMVEEPLVETVEVAEVEVLGEELIESDDRAPDPSDLTEIESFSASAASPPPGAADAGTGSAPPGRRRRRRHRRRPRPETGPVSGAGNGGLDPPPTKSESSNEE